MGEERGVYKVSVGNPVGKRPMGRPRSDWRIILRCIFRKWDVWVWTGLGWFRWRSIANEVMNLRFP
jgi:hypothetical protein